MKLRLSILFQMERILIPPGRDPRRRPSKPRPTPQLLQTETHRLGLMKTGERKGIKMEERERRTEGRAEEKNGGERKKSGK
jgi:hypothetical protein